eukprot:6182344-Pleurochrysis_carterae.AAC.3
MEAACRQVSVSGLVLGTRSIRIRAHVWNALLGHVHDIDILECVPNANTRGNLALLPLRTLAAPQAKLH